MTDPVPARLALLGQEAGDVEALSALLQDATLRLIDVGFDRKARRLALLINRFRREAETPQRIRSALRIEHVLAVQRAGWPADAPDAPDAPDANADGTAVTVILSLALDGDWITITCAGGTALRARIDGLDLVLEDLGAPWATQHVPDHGD